MKTGSVIKVLAIVPVMVLCICMLTQAAFAQGVPLVIMGHVTVNGVSMAGVTVSAGASSKTTDASGNYQLSPMIANGSSVTVTANYNGHTQSTTVTQHMQGAETVNFAITYSTETPNNGGSTITTGTITPTPVPQTNNSTSGSGTVSITPTPTPTLTPTPTPVPTPTPTPSTGLGSWWWLLLLLAALAIVAVYWFYIRKN